MHTNMFEVWAFQSRDADPHPGFYALRWTECGKKILQKVRNIWVIKIDNRKFWVRFSFSFRSEILLHVIKACLETKPRDLQRDSFRL